MKLDLVEKDYYPKELNYEQQIIKRNNLRELGEQIRLTQYKNTLNLSFPSSQKYDEVEGEILIYRPSDARADITVQIKLDTLNSQTINADKLLNGKYIVKVDWTYQDKSFYQELILIL